MYEVQNTLNAFYFPISFVAIYQIIKEDVEKAPEKLVNLAHEAGGLDNITIITIM